MIGDNIQSIRQRRGLTLSELAEQANISKSYLSNMENNLNKNPSIQIIERIATVLAVDFQTITGIKSIGEQLYENEWFEFVNELKASGVRIEQLKEYKTVVEFAKWQNNQLKKK